MPHVAELADSPAAWSVGFHVKTTGEIGYDMGKNAGGFPPAHLGQLGLTGVPLCLRHLVMRVRGVRPIGEWSRR